MPRLSLAPLRVHGRKTVGLGGVLAVAYFATVAAIAVARGLGGAPHAGLLASSPAGVVRGELWQLFTSGLVVSGPVGAELPAAAAIAALAVRRLGARTFWFAAALGHVGATLLAYVGVGVVWLAARADVDGVVDAPDYGISCVSLAAVGALVGEAMRARRESVGLAAVAAGLVVLAVLGLGSGLAGIEHVLAFTLGLVAPALARRSRRPAL